MKRSDGRRVIEVVLARDISTARAGLATFQPALAERMTEATLRNRATYSCFGTSMTRMDFPGVSEVWTAKPTAEAEVVSTEAAPVAENASQSTAQTPSEIQ